MSIAQVLSPGLRQAKSTNSLFTCLACQVAFTTSERQRGHYRTDWHKYNLKRKVSELHPVTTEQFAQKVLAQQAVGREEEERASLIYECGVCRRSYLTENSFSNHLKSKRHRELEFKSPKTKITSTTIGAETQEKPTYRQQLFSDDEELDAASDEPSNCGNDHMTCAASGLERSLVSCLFCNHITGQFDANLHHMVKNHGFFLPDVEYLVDVHGLIAYLFEKVVQDHICLFCNNRGKQWGSLEAVRAHMVDKGHCKMAYDDSEDPNALLNFYDFGPIDISILGSDDDDVVLLNDNMEWLLDNGTRIGHRQKLRYFKQHLRRKAPDTKQNLSIQDKEKFVSDLMALAKSEGNTLNRKQRRHLLIDGGALHGGDPQSTLATIQAQKQYSRKSHFQQQVSIKNNKNTTRRLRIQVPV